MNRAEQLFHDLMIALKDNTEWPVRVELERKEELNSAEYLAIFTMLRENGYKCWTTLATPKWSIDHLEINPL